MFDDGSKIISEKVVVHEIQQSIPNDEIESFFEISASLKLIREKNFQKIALQFPNNLQKYASTVIHLLQEKGPQKRKYFVVGDNTRGSCCVDVINSSFLECDSIFHYSFHSNTCLSTINIPNVQIFHVFGAPPSCFDFDECVKCMKSLLREEKSTGNSLFVQFDWKYHRQIGLLRDVFEDQIFFDEIPSEVSILGYEKPDKSIVRKIPGKEISVLFIGKKKKLDVTYLEYSPKKLFFYNEERNKIFDITEEYSRKIRRTLNKRYYLMNLAKCSKVFGILLANVTLNHHKEVLSMCKKFIKDAGRKFYVFYTSKITPEKLANFIEIDLFVVIDCSQNSFIESQEYFKPVVTPFELYMALRRKDWIGEYVLDFSRLLKLWDTDKEIEGEIDNVDVSLITGEVIGYNIMEGNRESEDISKRRKWKGLEGEQDEKPNERIEIGLSGVGHEYLNEGNIEKKIDD